MGRWDLSFSDQGSDPCLLQWKCRILTTRLPGKSSCGFKSLNVGLVCYAALLWQQIIDKSTKGKSQISSVTGHLFPFITPSFLCPCWLVWHLLPIVVIVPSSPRPIEKKKSGHELPTWERWPTLRLQMYIFMLCQLRKPGHQRIKHLDLAPLFPSSLYFNHLHLISNHGSTSHLERSITEFRIKKHGIAQIWIQTLA